PPDGSACASPARAAIPSAGERRRGPEARRLSRPARRLRPRPGIREPPLPSAAGATARASGAGEVTVTPPIAPAMTPAFMAGGHRAADRVDLRPGLRGRGSGQRPSVAGQWGDGPGARTG